ncbi:PEP-CTERM sorting domain-containing protein [Azohydromonas australica]|uniref:PEP-CTERM sorting domain-containing protein n=1 Tax=Azohydromonas australica TaxID=364039 RepID=UPI0004237CDF|nr:PEP-CTERM sorting domain-containing protein [Azohydromonas australica]
MVARHSLVGLAISAALALVAADAQAQLRYRLKVLSFGVPVGEEEFFNPAAINNLGAVAGTGYREGDEWYDLNAIAHVALGKTAVPLLGAEAFTESQAYGINDRNQIVGSYRLPDTGDRVPYLYQGGHYRNLRVEDTKGDDFATDVNASGQAVGRANGRAFLFDGVRSRYIDVPGAVSSQALALNDHGSVVGSATFNAPGGDYEDRAFVYDGREVRLLSSPPNSQPAQVVTINNPGQMATIAYNPDDNATRSFIYEADGQVTQIASLATPPGEREVTTVTGLNNRGWAVGRSVGSNCTESTCFEAFLWRDGKTVSLNDLLVPWQAKRWHLSDAVAINDRGQITGRASFDFLAFDTYVLTPVPEPQGWALLLAGLGLVGMVARPRQHRPVP